LLAQAQLALTGGRLEAVEPLLKAAERARAGAADEPFEPTIGKAGSLPVNVPAHITLDRSYLAQFRGDAEATATAAFASQALAQLGEGEWMLNAAAVGFLAVAEWLRGRLAEAEHSFASGIAGWQEADQPTPTAWGCYSLSQVQRAQGRLDAAARTCQQARRTGRRAPRPARLPGPAPARV